MVCPPFVHGLAVLATADMTADVHAVIPHSRDPISGCS
jgi:hypothetical protein